MAVNLDDGAGGYDNRLGSNIYAHPTLQDANERTVDNITRQVEEVHEVKRETFAPKTDKRIAYLLAAAATAIAVLGFFAIFAVHATGIGGGITAAALLIVLVAAYGYDKAASKEASTAVVQGVHRDATRHRVAKVIRREQQNAGIEMVPVHRHQARAHRPAYVPGRQPQAVENDDALGDL